MKIELDPNPTPEDIQQIHNGLDHFNTTSGYPTKWEPLAVYIRDEAGAVHGGLTGGTFWSWCHVDILWLDDGIRGQGYGSQLLQLAEAEAVRRGCVGIFLDTTSFQAPEFYTKHGYSEWGRLEDFPPGHQRIFFQKRLV